MTGEVTFTVALFLNMTHKWGVDLVAVILSLTVLYAPSDVRYVCAVLVVFTCHGFMRVLSRLPRIGMYFFMIKMVFVSILKFLLSYIWHFFGYAVAFHILLPNKDAFATLGDSLVKVRCLSFPSS